MGGAHGGEPCTRLRQTAAAAFRRVAGTSSRANTALNRSVASSKLGRYFKLDARDTSFTRELRAGTATFLTMAYIISVNASILADSGGPCNNNRPGAKSGRDDDGCLSAVRTDFVSATALTAMVGSVAMGAVANLPFAVAPGMGSNAYFTYNMVGLRGSGPLSYETALAAVMLEGCAFLLLSALGLRARLARAVPRPLRLASAAGIGLFLASAGLQAHQGLGLVGPSESTLVTLADGAMRSPRLWLGAAGFVVTATCLSKGVRGGMIYGIVLVTVASWFRRTPVTYFPNTPEGDSGYAYFTRVVDLRIGGSTSGKMSFDGLLTYKVWIHLLTLLYVDVLDTTGSMYSMAEYGGFTDEKGRFEGEYRAFIVDAGSTVISASLGTTTVTTFLESTAGIKEGGRTGITAMTVGACFAVAMVFKPVMTSVPPWAVGGSLVLVGVMMMRVAKEVEWGEMREAVPAFVTMVVMPLTFSIANGIVAGIGVWVAMGAWDWVFGGVMWVWRAREMMKEARNQVAATATATATAVDDVEHVV